MSINSTDNPNPSIEWLDEVLQHYKEYITGVYQGMADYDEATAKAAILSHIEAEKREAKIEAYEDIAGMADYPEAFYAQDQLAALKDKG